MTVGLEELCKDVVLREGPCLKILTRAAQRRADALVVVFCGLARVHLDGLQRWGQGSLESETSVSLVKEQW